MTDEEGRVHWRARYKTWGNLALQEQPEADSDRFAQPQLQEQNLRLQGQYFDAETGLCYNTFRYYDPGCGRFISQDPIGLAGGLNLYQFAPNAIGWIDPWGWASSNPGVYDVFGEARIDKEMYRASDYKHFQEANRQLYYKMKADQALKSSIESKYPGTFDHVSPGKRGAFSGKAPPGLTWHHHEQVGGLLQLVDTTDHNSRHKDYHPTGRGGRNKWGGGSGCR
ncbi:MAG: Rhs-family protein [Ideonella sp. MAG2]|nr:MAG: Rhs-family protein [Ideonella sp. MAG2]